MVSLLKLSNIKEVSVFSYYAVCYKNSCIAVLGGGKGSESCCERLIKLFVSLGRFNYNQHY